MTTDTEPAGREYTPRQLAEMRACHAYRRLIYGLLYLTGQLAHAHDEAHGEACDCAGCHDNPVADVFSGEWAVTHDRILSDRKRVSGLFIAAGYNCEFFASALDSELPGLRPMGGQSWGDDLRQLADMADRADAQNALIPDGDEPTVVG